MAAHTLSSLGFVLPCLIALALAQSAIPTGTGVVCPLVSGTYALSGCSTMLEAIYLCDTRFSSALTACSSEYGRCYGTIVDSGNLFRSVISVRSQYCSSSGNAPTSVTAGILTGTSASSASFTSAASSVSSGSSSSSSASSSSASGRSTSLASASSTQSQASPTASAQSTAVTSKSPLSILYMCVGLLIAAVLTSGRLIFDVAGATPPRVSTLSRNENDKTAHRGNTPIKKYICLIVTV